MLFENADIVIEAIAKITLLLCWTPFYWHCFKTLKVKSNEEDVEEMVKYEEEVKLVLQNADPNTSQKNQII